ncbi:uncharacterized protein NPIL_552071 [Nephila pilipes]|uniref:Uncharacterized protein n=1 Tax=Nephila pilipes TaxID=299642 RepID=A0A8X6NQ94_NEPPI|nr:uncharacterized protein NPIL_16891 [Nephila pilipes]GFT71250.1 uncharacterized protein NPIL_552071 [Nephila pilipes]
MDSFKSYEIILRRLAIKPLLHIQFQPPTLMVTFEDGDAYTEKFDLLLRVFLISLQDVQYQRKEVSPDCITTPLGFFKLLGWRVGDAVLFQREDIKMAIVFS